MRAWIVAVAAVVALAAAGCAQSMRDGTMSRDGKTMDKKDGMMMEKKDGGMMEKK